MAHEWNQDSSEVQNHTRFCKMDGSAVPLLHPFYTNNNMICTVWWHMDLWILWIPAVWWHHILFVQMLQEEESAVVAPSPTAWSSGFEIASFNYCRTPSYFQKELLLVEEVSNEYPDCCAQHILKERLGMGGRRLHLPAEREVTAQKGVSNVDKDGIHSCTFMKNKSNISGCSFMEQNTLPLYNIL